jgi:hypothetical protein
MNETLREWLQHRDRYISEILDLEKPPADQLCSRCNSQDGCFRCKECFSQDLLCDSCCFAIHRNSPFHHIEKWTGQFFDTTSLNKEGFVLHLGHGGEPCPASCSGGDNVQLGSSDEDEGEEERVAEETYGVPLAGWEKQDRRSLVIIDTSGVHQLRVSWCQCETAIEPHIQLLRHRLFPATTKRPSTAFTFSLLEYFHIDSVECKTSASSFFSKLRRLTNNSNPQAVPVCQATV